MHGWFGCFLWVPLVGAHVVAVDADTGAVVAGTLGGWSFSTAGPPQFDGSYSIERLPAGRSYIVYAEPLGGTVVPAQVYNALGTLWRNATTDAGWPPLQGCVVPEVATSFTTRVRPQPRPGWPAAHRRRRVLARACACWQMPGL